MTNDMNFTVQRDSYFHEILGKHQHANSLADQIMTVIMASDAAPNDQDHCGMTIHELAEEDESLVLDVVYEVLGSITPKKVLQIGRLTIIGLDGDCPFCGAYTEEVWDGYTKYVTCHNDNCDYSLEDVLTKEEYYEP